MRAAAWIAASFALVAGLWFLTAPGTPVAPAMVAVPSATPRPAALPAVHVEPATTAKPPQAVRLHGILHRGAPGGSQALLSVDGRAASSYQVGDVVTDGWSLADIEPGHVLLARGAARARLEPEPVVATDGSRRTGADAGVVPVGLAAGTPVAQKPLAGFLPGGAPAMAQAPQAGEANKRFLADRQKRLARPSP